jgi:hypothetical protein
MDVLRQQLNQLGEKILPFGLMPTSIVRELEKPERFAIAG